MALGETMIRVVRVRASVDDFEEEAARRLADVGGRVLSASHFAEGEDVPTDRPLIVGWQFVVDALFIVEAG